MLTQFQFLPIAFGHYVKTEGVERDEIFAMLTLTDGVTDYHFQYYLS